MKIPKAEHRGNLWRIQLNIDGQRHVVTAADEAECIAKAAALKAGLVPDSGGSKRTLSECVEGYILRKSNVLSPSTIRGYRILQRNRFTDLMPMPVRKITKPMLQAAVNREALLCSPKTLKNAVGLILAAMADETGTRYTITTPQAVVKEHPFLSPDQVPLFLEAIKGSSIEIPCLMGLWSLRCSEILGLRWQDIDLTHGLIHVNGACVPDETGALVRKDSTKNKTSRRAVPICDRLAELLRPLAEGKDADAPVVTITPLGLRKHINAVCQRNDLPLIGVHGLRHSFISVGYLAGVPVTVLQELGGWSNDATIKKHYLHIAQADKTRYQNSMLDKFSSLF